VARTGLAARFAAQLQYPSAADVSIDSPEATIERWQLIRDKIFLRRIYDEWYTLVASAIPATEKPVLELGSGAGFLSDYVDGLITSDILELPQVSRVLDACAGLPFEDGSLRGIAMVNTLHHLPDVEAFFSEASRCLERGGAVSMIEPWNSPWSKFVYSRLHHEPFEPAVAAWAFESSGPLSSANGALPWILFNRDRTTFEQRFPDLQIHAVQPIMPIRYLLSGGVSMRPLVPSWSFTPLRAAENASTRLTRSTAMFAHIAVLRR
jgi:SAM-dependent methyltransferase